jgi:hypothetical protein
MAQDTGKFRTNTKDQYYTKESVAKHCIESIESNVLNSSAFQWIEPSAGNGVFLKSLPSTIDKLGIDIDPKDASIIKGDFLQWSPVSAKQRIFFGNPPFGRQGSSAKKFIQHASIYANIIAFILPRSFVKPSMSRAFPLMFHCIYSGDLPKDCFEVNGKSYDVPCVFQIWERKEMLRAIVEAVQEEGFQFVKRDDVFDFACKRVGGLAGKCSTGQKEEFNPQYHYYIQLEDEYKPHVKKIVESMNSHTFPSNTVGPRSLSKSEISEVLNRFLQQISS